MEEDAAEEQRQTKRPAEDDAEESAKRPKQPPSPTKWREDDEAAVLLLGVRQEQATLYDPKRGSYLCCRGFDSFVCEPAVFDHEEECKCRWLAMQNCKLNKAFRHAYAP